MSESPFGHESPAIQTGRVLAVLGALAVVVVIALVVVHLVLSRGVMPNHGQVVARPGMIPPVPRLQPHPDRDIANERAQKEGMLSQYAWTDPAHRYARIPIQRAMQLYAQQHAADHGPHSAASPVARGAGR